MLKAKRNKLEKRVSSYIAPEYGEISPSASQKSKSGNAHKLAYVAPAFTKAKKSPTVFSYF
jgi:hypothetical protein